MAVVEKRERGERIEELGETEGARRATGVFPSAAAAAIHRGVQAADRAGGGPLHARGRDRGAAAARGPVLLASDELAGGAGSRGARGAYPEAARAEGEPARS